MLAQRLATPEQVEYATHVTPRKAPLHIPSPPQPTAEEPPWVVAVMGSSAFGGAHGKRSVDTYQCRQGIARVVTEAAPDGN